MLLSSTVVPLPLLVGAAAASGSNGGMHGPGFVADLAVVLGVAAVTGLLFRLMKQPSVLGYLLAGLIVGPYLPVPLFADPARVHSLSEFGVVLVMFAVGLEFRIEKFLKVLPVSGVTGLIEIGALFATGYFVGGWLGWNETQSLFLGACLCISSTMAVSKILEQQPVAIDVRQFIFGVLVLQDVAAIALIAVMTAVAQGSGASFSGVLGILGQLVVILLLIVAVGMFLVPRFVRVLVRTKSTETLVVGAMGLCFSLALLATELGYSGALGAFIAGILVAESGEGKRTEHALASTRDVFAAVFFVSIGMSVDPLVALESFPTALAVLGVVIATQFLSVSIGGVLSGSGLRRSVTSGLALGQIGEFAFIISAIGVSARVVPRQLQPILVTVAVLSTFTTSLALKFRDQVAHAVDRALPDRVVRVLSLYEAWIDEMRTRQEGRSRVAVTVRGILLDVGIMVGIVLAWKTFEKEVETTLASTFHIGHQLSHTLALVALALALLPPFVPLMLSARRLSYALTERVFGEERSSARALVRAVIILLIVAAVGVPGVIVLGPLIGVQYVWAGFAVALAIAAFVAWRRMGIVDDQIQSGGVMLLRAIADQGLPEARESRTSIPGMSNLHEVILEDGDFAVGKSLAELRVRSLTGASVVALRRDEGSMTMPTGVERLSVGDTLYVAGNHEDQEAAERLFSLGAVGGISDPGNE